MGEYTRRCGSPSQCTRERVTPDGVTTNGARNAGPKNLRAPETGAFHKSSEEDGLCAPGAGKFPVDFADTYGIQGVGPWPG